MHVTKMIGMILLSVYLILSGLSMMSEVNLAPMASNLVQLCAVGAGILILISINKSVRDKR